MAGAGFSISSGTLGVVKRLLETHSHPKPSDPTISASFCQTSCSCWRCLRLALLASHASSSSAAGICAHRNLSCPQIVWGFLPNGCSMLVASGQRRAAQMLALCHRGTSNSGVCSFRSLKWHSYVSHPPHAELSFDGHCFEARVFW